MRGERAVLAGLGGGCQLPVGAYAVVEDDELTLSGVVVALDRPLSMRSQTTGPAREAEDLGRWVADDLLRRGADNVKGGAMMFPLTGLRIVVTRAAHQAEELVRPLCDRGAAAVLLPVIEIGPPENPEPLAAGHCAN